MTGTLYISEPRALHKLGAMGYFNLDLDKRTFQTTQIDLEIDTQCVPRSLTIADLDLLLKHARACCVATNSVTCPKA